MAADFLIRERRLLIREATQQKRSHSNARSFCTKQKASAPAFTTAKAPVAQAFGNTFILAPTFCARFDSEDSITFSTAVKFPGLAVAIRSEVQPTARMVEFLEAQAAIGVPAPKALLGADTLLGADANRVLNEPNAGGASRVSEAMSAEFLSRAFGSALLQTECEIAYWPSNSSITDFSVILEGVVLGVSVTRAICQPGMAFSIERAESLLKKKLLGVTRSTENACGAWGKQILHIWAPSSTAAAAVEAAYAKLNDIALIADTVVLISVCEGLAPLFEEKQTSTGGGQPKPRKGLKDAEHLRVLAESDPTAARVAVSAGFGV